jgi:TetR/AcrR family transcriptional repressor of nem operon
MMVALSAPMLFVPLAAAVLTRWMSAGVISAIGLVIAALGMRWFSDIAPDAPALAFAIPTFVIGVGAGSPWGLMDRLSLSVVPKERVGMATGIFSTMRVAGEGMSLAAAGAILAVLTQGQLADALSGRAVASPNALAEAAQRVATGDMPHAVALLPGIGGQSVLTQAYDSVFRTLLQIPVAVTLASALVILGFLGRSPAPAVDASDTEPVISRARELGGQPRQVSPLALGGCTFETTGHIIIAMSARRTEDFPEKLLEAGVTLFAEKGFHGTGVKDIVERAGVPKGSFYNYFDSKEAFGAAILRHYADSQAAEWQQYSREADSPDPLLALRTIYERIVADYEACDDRCGCLLGNFAGEIAQSSELCRTTARQTVDEWRVGFAEYLRRGQNHGSVRNDLSADTLADFFWNAWEGSLLRMKLEDSIEPLKACVHLMFDLFFKSAP